MKGGRIETEFHHMLTCRYIHRTKNVVGTTMRYFLPIDG